MAFSQGPRFSYQQLFHIASGGMAEVDAALARAPGAPPRVVALKRMRRELASNAKLATMFADEARIASQIHSPYVVTTSDRGRLDGRLFIAMDLVVGATLGELHSAACDRGALLPLAVVIAVLRDVASGLRDAHESCDAVGRPLGIVHRDVSPQNVLVGRDGIARVADFGIAKAAHRLRCTEPGTFKGKISYAAPEQLSGLPVDARTDLFAWGLCAWELLTGRRPFERAASPAEMAQKMIDADIADPRSVRSDIPRPLAELVLHALRPAPADRVATARTVVVALEKLTVHLGIAVGPTITGAMLMHLLGEQVRALETRLVEATTGTIAAPSASGTHRVPALRERDDATTSVDLPIAARRR